MKNICTFLKITIKSEVWILTTNFLTNWTCDLSRFLNKINQGIFTTKLIDLNDSHRMLGKEQVAKNWEVNDPLTIISPFKKSGWRERQRVKCDLSEQECAFPRGTDTLTSMWTESNFQLSSRAEGCVSELKEDEQAALTLRREVGYYFFALKNKNET